MVFKESQLIQSAAAKRGEEQLKQEPASNSQAEMSLVTLKEKKAKEEKEERERKNEYHRRFNNGELSAEEQGVLNPELAEIYQAKLEYKREFQQNFKKGNLSNEDVCRLSLDELAEYAEIREGQGKEIFNHEDEKIKTLKSQFKRAIFKVAIALGFLASATNAIAKEINESDQLKPDLKANELTVTNEKTDDSDSVYVVKAEDLEGGGDRPKDFFSELEASMLSYPGWFRGLTPDDIKDLDAAQKIEKIIEHNPAYILDHADQCQGIPNINLFEIITKAGGADARTFFYNIPKYQKELPDLNLAEIVNKVVDGNEVFVFQYLSDIKKVPDIDLAQIVNKVAVAAPDSFLNNLHQVTYLFDLTNIDLPQLISEAGEKEPASLLINAQYLRNYSDQYELGIIENKAVNGMYELMLSQEQSNYDNKTKSKIIDNAFNGLALDVVSRLNILHNRSDAERFKLVENFNCKALYTAMVYGEDFIYTSSFNGCFNRLMDEMDKEGVGGQDLLDQVANNKFRVFTKECVGYNRLGEFLSRMDNESASQLLKNVVKNIDSQDNKLDQAITVAEIIGSLNDTSKYQVIQEQIKSELERLNSDSKSLMEDKIIYGILAGMVGDDAVVDKEWFKSMQDQYPVEVSANIESSEIFDQNGVCVQKYHFFEDGDNDGINSFNNFIKRYGQDRAWKIDKSHESFVVITAENGDKKVEIYANNPSFKEGLADMDKLLAEKNAKIKLYSYRGHSYGLSLDGVTEETKIISLGSCGGFSDIDKIQYPSSHVISTKGTGSMYVNDPMLYDLNAKILNGENIDWAEFWAQEEAKLGGNENFKNYIPPHKNQGLMFKRAYNTKIDELHNP